jgi:hypothetical protein
MTVHLVSVIGSHLDLLPHMLRHYSSLGIESFLINVHCASEDDPIYEQAVASLDKWNIRVANTYVGDWVIDVNTRLYRQSMAKYPHDWYVITDLDEFHVYPDALKDFLRSMERRGLDAVPGLVVDRVARGGLLSGVLEDVSIWSQFPLGATVTYSLLKANCLEVVAARGFVELSHGQHMALTGKACPLEQECVPVHHFKWTSGLAERLEKRVSLYKAYDIPYWRQSQRFLEFFRRSGRKLDLSPPEFLVAECVNEYRYYPNWTQFRDKCLSVRPE